MPNFVESRFYARRDRSSSKISQNTFFLFHRIGLRNSSRRVQIANRTCGHLARQILQGPLYSEQCHKSPCHILKLNIELLIAYCLFFNNLDSNIYIYIFFLVNRLIV
jgi:hypothetical protein